MKLIFKMSEDHNKQISEHFKVYEFSSTSPNPYQVKHIYSDKVIINKDLVKKIEKLMTMLNCNHAYISSGYRTDSHDKDVGGNGLGEHTKGNAVDIKFMAKNGYWINTKIISVMAQIIGFKGIARINDTTIHLDVREGQPYFGDETIGTNTVTDDFKSYYKITDKILIDYLLKLWRYK